MALVGLGAAGGGGFLAAKTGPQVDALEEAHAENPAQMARDEQARMVKVNANWPRLKMAWGVLAGIAVLLLLAVKKDWSTGLGLALMFIAALTFWIDVFAERRAVPYTIALDAAVEASNRGGATPEADDG